MEPESPKKMSKVVLPLVILLVVASLGASYYFYSQYQKSQKLLKDPTAAQTAEVKAVTAEVGKIMDLPTGEDPSIATVLDKSKLTDQPFFVKAQNGDKVLIYTKSGEAILYRPSTNHIVNVSPINLGTPAPSPVASPVATPAAK